MKVNTYQCDVCGVQKKETNCWWKAFIVTGGVMIYGWEASLSAYADGALGDAAHLCGMNCLTQWLSKNLVC